MRRTIRVLLALLVATVPATVALAGSPASAATGDLVCAAALQANFTPALTVTNTSATVSLSGALTNCLSFNGIKPGLASGTVSATGTAASASGSRCSLRLTLDVEGDVTWSPTVQRSHFTGALNTDPANGRIRLVATLTSGPLAGDSALIVPVLANPNLDCRSRGLRSLASVLTVAAFR